MKKERELPEPVILAAQLRGERSIAKARYVLLAILAAFAAYVFASAVAERGMASEIARPVYYVELACIVLAAASTFIPASPPSAATPSLPPDPGIRRSVMMTSNAPCLNSSSAPPTPCTIVHTCPGRCRASAITSA